MKKRKKKGWEEKREDVGGDSTEEGREKNTNGETKGVISHGSSSEGEKIRDKESNRARQRTDVIIFIHLIPLEQTLLLLRGLHLVLRASPLPLHLQIISFVNTLSSRHVTPV